MPELKEIQDWWTNVLKKPKFVVAPMVAGSELPWRILARRYKADLTFTPMLNSKNFLKDPKYRATNFFDCLDASDRPLICQFCGDDPEVIAQCALLVKDYVDGVDINLGCPQNIARSGHYGAFLQDEWDLIANIVKRINEVAQIPVSCKIRVFPEIQKTIEYAKNIENAGAWMLTVHGRTREMKGPFTGLANWDYVKAVREIIKIPMLSNGNIQSVDDALRCIEETQVDGVMSAEGHLHNPAIFTGTYPLVWDIAQEYLLLVRAHPCPLSFSRGHLFKLFQHIFAIKENEDLREELFHASSHLQMEEITSKLKDRYEPYSKGEKEWTSPPEISDLKLKPWFCQPYIRPPPPSDQNSNSESEPKPVNPKRIKLNEESKELGISKNQFKKMKKSHKTNMDKKPKTIHPLCINSDTKCLNPKGLKCDYNFCGHCCRSHCKAKQVNCNGHKRFRKDCKGKELEATEKLVASTS